MSLGTFFRDYVYIPLGGNRKHQMLNLFVVWSLTGLWHGASWNFLLWGLYFFAILVLEKKYYAKYKRKVIKPVRRLVNLLLILIGWVIFYFTDMGELGRALAAMIGFAGGGFISTEAKIQLLNNLLLLIACVIGVTPVPRIVGDAFGLICASPEPESVKKKVYVIVYYVFCLTVIVLSTISLVGSGFSAFLYYRF